MKTKRDIFDYLGSTRCPLWVNWVLIVAVTIADIHALNGGGGTDSFNFVWLNVALGINLEVAFNKAYFMMGPIMRRRFEEWIKGFEDATE